MTEPGMKFIGDIVPLSRKEMDKYMSALLYEAHLPVTAERLRGDMAGLAAYCQRRSALLIGTPGSSKRCQTSVE